jgi:hypothetical protein
VTPAEPTEDLVVRAANDRPPTDLMKYLARLGAAGAVTVGFHDAFGGERTVVYADGRGVHGAADVDWSQDAPIATALEELAGVLQKFDRVRRLRLATSDMDIAEATAEALIDAKENDGPARLYERVLETGLVVTFTRLPRFKRRTRSSKLPPD